jgi:large subunit ribosomal protein L16
MGSGKGAVDHWVAVVRPGRVIFEMSGIPDDVAKEALRLAASKLPMGTKIISRQSMQA